MLRAQLHPCTTLRRVVQQQHRAVCLKIALTQYHPSIASYTPRAIFPSHLPFFSSPFSSRSSKSSHEIKHQAETKPQIQRQTRSASHKHRKLTTFVDGMLARDFISSSLYKSGSGYFNSSARVYRSDSPAAIPFTQLADRADYHKKLQSMYERYDECWLTPVEIFKPYYAQAIARWILEGRRKDLGNASVPQIQHAEEEGLAPEFTEGESKPAAANNSPATYIPSPSSPVLPPLRIMELGGGNGTCALGVLDYLEKHYPDLYCQTEYTIVELSEYMTLTQRDTLAKHTSHHKRVKASGASLPAGSQATSPRVRLLNMSIIEWRELIEDPTVFVIGLEVLDNMPHDRLLKDKKTGEMQQIHVMQGAHGSGSASLHQMYSERVGDVTDDWIREYGMYWMEMQEAEAKSEQAQEAFKSSKASLMDVIRSPSHTLALWYSQKSTQFKQSMQMRQTVWFPTTSLMFMHILKHYIPNHHLLLADFSHLPSTVEGAWGPVVSAKDASSRGKTVDYETYLVEQGTVDIFFPTDFPALGYVYQRVCMGKKPEQVHHLSMKSAKQEEEEAQREQANGATTSSDSAAAAPTKNGRAIANPRIMSQYAFMDRYGMPSKPLTRTKDGFNPLWQDYLNFHFFLV